MHKGKFAFFGTDSIAISVLNELEKAGFIPSVLVCSEDKERGRGMDLTPPPAKVWAQERNVPVLQPKKLDGDFVSQISSFNLEFAIVASYGKIIPESVLNVFLKGALNTHPSLLPKLRGPAPIEYTILQEEKAGVTIIKLDKEMDHGPILIQKEITFSEWPPKYSVAENILGTEGGKILAEILQDYLDGKIELKEQNHPEATLTKKISKEDGLIDLNNSPIENLRKIRAFEEWPGAYFFFEGKKGKVRVKVKEAHIESDQLILDSVIPEGKKQMDWQRFLRGV